MEPTKCEYVVLFDRTIGEFQQIVQSYLDKGWSLEGGVCVVPGSGYYQALVRQLEK